MLVPRASLRSPSFRAKRPALGVRELAQGVPMPRMRDFCTGPDARARRERQARRVSHLLERERIELRHDFAREAR